jgi:hypothetical protein
MKSSSVNRWILSFTAVMLLAVLAPYALGEPCVLPDNGTGTVTLPNPDCPYLSPTDTHLAVDGLPPGTQIIFGAIHERFTCESAPVDSCLGPGGPLGGEIEENIDSNLHMEVSGTGELATFHRSIDVPVQFTAATGPRTLGDPVQTFANEMVQLQGGITGDPDFDVLQVTAGNAFGLPSPGQTTLTRLSPPGADGGTVEYNVDSFFDITYRIDFQGAPGSVLAGFGGSTTATVHMQTVGGGATPAPPGFAPFSWGRVKTLYKH